MFDKFSTGNFYLREHRIREHTEQGTHRRIGKDWEGLGNTQKTIKSSHLSLIKGKVRVGSNNS
jgi:hypothetical protein